MAETFSTNCKKRDNVKIDYFRFFQSFFHENVRNLCVEVWFYSFIFYFSMFDRMFSFAEDWMSEALATSQAQSTKHVT